jgi:hypothetical protein
LVAPRQAGVQLWIPSMMFSSPFWIDNRFWMNYRRDANKLEDALLKMLPSAGTDGRQYGPE